jgi:tetratricopeptide (TPR) repeat protein
MAAIFISHSSLDRKASDDIKTELAKLGFERVFLDIDKDDGISAGENWEKRLYEEISRCHAVALVLTPNWLASKWCFVELAQARALGKVILPIICEPLGGHTILPDIQAVDLLDWNEAGLQRLEQRLKAIAHDLARGFTLDPERPPYPGIQAFEAEDAAIYFGRDDEARVILERLEARRTQGGARMLIIIGASGSGKSSLLKAAVLPQLSRRRREWVVLQPIRPEKAPLETLAKSIAQQLGQPADWRAWHERLTGASAIEHIEELLKDLRVGDARNATILLPVDQFEEVFTVATPAERTAFLQLLTKALDPQRRLPAMVVATGRSDVLDGLIEAGDLARITESYPLPLMPLDRVRRLVEGPAAVAGLHVDKGLAERIERDVETPEALPLLAQALWLLHSRGNAARRLGLADYELLGDAKRGLNPIQNSVRLVADQALAGAHATEHELAALRDAFVPHLVRVRLDDGKRVRQPARLVDLPNDSLRLVRVLIDARLLTMHGGETAGEPVKFGDAVVDVAHEALFKAWPTLDQWLTEAHGFLIDIERIRGAHEIWAQAPPEQKPAALLRGLLLSRARDWLLKYPQRFTAREMEEMRAFIAASAQAEDADRILAEAQREKTRRMERRMFQGAIAASLIFAATALLAGWQYFFAEKELKRANENYKAALVGGRETVGKIEDLLDAGLEATHAKALLDISSRSAESLAAEQENDEIADLQWRLKDVLSSAYLAVPRESKRALELAIEEQKHAQQLLARKPRDVDRGRYLALSNRRVADALEEQGRLAEAFKLNDEAREVVDELLKSAPSNPELILIKGIIHQRLGDIRRKNRDFDGALKDYSVFLRTHEILAARPNPKSPWIRNLAISHQRIGDILLDTGKPGEALQAYRKYQEVAARLVATEKDDLPNYTWRLDLGIAHQRNGDALHQLGRYEEALTEHEAYRKVAEEATQRNPENGQWQRFLGNSHILIGDALLGLGKADIAAKHFRQAVEIYAKLAKDELKANWQRTLAIAHLRAGKALLMEQDPKASDEFKACLDIKVDDKAIDPQIRLPRFVHQECRQQAEQQ